eukprot:scaffold6634_cov158-Amphora_coffeaeformis.AAC.22
MAGKSKKTTASAFDKLGEYSRAEQDKVLQQAVTATNKKRTQAFSQEQKKEKFAKKRLKELGIDLCGDTYQYTIYRSSLHGTVLGEHNSVSFTENDGYKKIAAIPNATNPMINEEPAPNALALLVVAAALPASDSHVEAAGSTSPNDLIRTMPVQGPTRAVAATQRFASCDASSAAHVPYGFSEDKVASDACIVIHDMLRNALYICTGSTLLECIEGLRSSLSPWLLDILHKRKPQNKLLRELHVDHFNDLDPPTT